MNQSNSNQPSVRSRISRRRIVQLGATGVGIVSAAAVVGRFVEEAGMAQTAATPDADGTPGATPESGTPSASPAAPEEVTVVIANLTFSPLELTVAAGTAVTWVNEDAVPHTATALDRDVLQSGTIMPGESYSHVFSDAGRYDYFCELHADMNATVIVT